MCFDTHDTTPSIHTSTCIFLQFVNFYNCIFLQFVNFYNCIFLQFVYFYSKKKIVSTPDETSEVIDVDSQDSFKYDSDTTSVLVDDDNDSKYDTAEYHVESAAEDEEISDEEIPDSDDDVEEESDESIGTGDVSVLESNEESDDESENESKCSSDDGHYLDDFDKEEYGAVVETDTNPDFDDIVDMILHKKVTTAHVTSPSGRKIVYHIGKAAERKKLRRIFAKITEEHEDYSWVLRNKTESKKEKASRGSFSEGFNPAPSSEEESSDEEVEDEDNAAKSKLARKKNATTETTAGCKPTKRTGKKEIDDDDEEKVKRKKPNGTSMKNTAKNPKGNGEKSVNSRKKTGGNNSKTGKPIKKNDLDGSEKDLSDDDSVDFGDPTMLDNLNKQVKEDSRSLFSVFVSPQYHDVIGEKLVHCVSFGKPNATFYLKAPHQKAVLTWLHSKKKLGNVNHVPKWIETLEDIKVRNIEHGLESKWYKTKKGNTTEIIFFVVAIPEDEGDTFHDVLKDIIEHYFRKAFKTRKQNPPGEAALAFAQTLSDPSRPGTGLYNWLVTAKGKKDHEAAARAMTKEIDDHFKDGPAYHYDVFLDKFMVDFNIKEFLNNHVGINSWDDLNEAGRKACFKEYPKRFLPDWDLMLQEAY